MNLRGYLSERIGAKDVSFIRTMIETQGGDATIEALIELTADESDRVSYNALWVLTHFSKSFLQQLQDQSDKLINMLLSSNHTGKRRLTLNLLEKLNIYNDCLRADFVDLCFTKINSTEPYGIRALCLKIAYKMCLPYPDLRQELLAELEIMELNEISPGLTSVRRHILKQISDTNDARH